MKASLPEANHWLRLQPTDDGVEASHGSLSLDNRGLVYGDGFFTTMGVIAGEILWLDYHHQRLLSHAKALQLALDSHSLITTLQRHAAHLQQGMLKLIVNRAAQDVRGYGYAPSTSGSACDIWLKPTVMTVSTDKQLRLAGGRSVPIQPASAAVCLSAQIACLPSPLAGLKSLNRLDTVLASAELQRIKTCLVDSDPAYANGALAIGEGLVRDMSGCWVEGTMSNVFYQLADRQATALPSSASKSIIDTTQKDSNYLTTGQWYTPSLAQSGVAGVMRQVIIDALSRTENPVVIRSLQDEDLPKIKRLFFCNALRGIMPMTHLTLLTGDIVNF
ncbi:aminotransferase class IV [Psychrobacter sp. B38]|uniref:aminotransferase class IV n=1 Tax=Psychrobacter sp. B38 TaxID=3143538 RepID=UPI00320CF023